MIYFSSFKFGWKPIGNVNHFLILSQLQKTEQNAILVDLKSWQQTDWSEDCKILIKMPDFCHSERILERRVLRNLQIQKAPLERQTSPKLSRRQFNVCLLFNGGSIIQELFRQSISRAKQLNCMSIRLDGSTLCLNATRPRCDNKLRLPPLGAHYICCPFQLTFWSWAILEHCGRV